jgi:hypothetical protein
MSCFCWLCRFNSSADAKTAQSFITENAGAMTPHEMAADLTRDLNVIHPGCIDEDACHTHIMEHSLNPSLQMALMLRSLLRLRDDVQKNLRHVDEEGNTTVDPKLVETYLKVQNQIMTLYKTNEVNKLLFSNC